MNKKELLINSVKISSKQPPYIIAEISANHNGSIERAKDTIIAAKKAGVDAVKIQTYTPDTMTINVKNSDFQIKNGLWKDRTLYDLYSQAYTPYEWHQELFLFSKNNEITLFSSPFDESAVDLLESLNTPAYKIASFEIVDIPLIKYIASKNKPVLISTGMASLNEVENAIKNVRKMGNDKIALFHCISSYPTPLTEANLNSITLLRNKFDVQVGLSDHTIGNKASILATSLGATIIEKHFTLNRSDGGVDSSFSLEPIEMANLVRSTKDAFAALGTNDFRRSSSEVSNKIFRRSLYFVKNINKGDIITKEHVRRIRPGFGLNPKYYEKVIGTICIKSAERGDRVTFQHISKENS